MDLLFYWKREEYQGWLEDDARGHDLNGDTKTLHEVEPGERVWAFTRRANNTYALAEELVVGRKVFNPPNSKFGDYRVEGDLVRSRYFEVEGQPDLAPLIRRLSITANAKILAQSFQGHSGIRRLTEEDSFQLREWSTKLPALELDLLEEDDLYDDRQSENTDDLERVPASVLRRRGQQSFRQLLLTRYGGRCAITGCDAEPALEAAHILPYSQGGRHQVENGLLLRADLHTLFDLGLIAVDSETKRVLVAPELHGTTYEDELSSAKVRPPYPRKDHLQRHLAAARGTWRERQ